MREYSRRGSMASRSGPETMVPPMRWRWRGGGGGGKAPEKSGLETFRLTGPRTLGERGRCHGIGSASAIHSEKRTVPRIDACPSRAMKSSGLGSSCRIRARSGPASRQRGPRPTFRRSVRHLRWSHSLGRPARMTTSRPRWKPRKESRRAVRTFSSTPTSRFCSGGARAGVRHWGTDGEYPGILTRVGPR